MTKGSLDPLEHQEWLTPPPFPNAGKTMERLERARSPVIQQLTNKLLMAASADRQGGATKTGVRHWLRYNVFGLNTAPIQHLERDAPIALRLEAETRLMNFVVWLVSCKPTGRYISAESARKYVGEVVMWMRRVHSAEFAGGLELHRLQDLVKGMRRELGERPKRVRWGVRTQQLREAMDKSLPQRSSVQAQAWRAALALAFCMLLRGGEVAVPSGETFNPLQHLTREDIQVVRSKDGSIVLKLRLRVLKKRVMTGKTYFVFLRAGGKLIDAVMEVLLYLEMDPVEPGMEKHTPLFRHASGEAFRREEVAAVVKRLMASIGLDPNRFGAHSLRIGGATAALAAGIQPTLIRVLGRWSSDIYEIYCRLSLEAAAGMGALIGSTPFEDVEQGEFVSEDLEATSLELAAMRHVELDPESEEEEL